MALHFYKTESYHYRFEFYQNSDNSSNFIALPSPRPGDIERLARLIRQRPSSIAPRAAGAASERHREFLPIDATEPLGHIM